MMDAWLPVAGDWYPTTNAMSKISTNILAIHQPNYFPWLGYFFKIYASDTFVFLDDVQFIKRGLTKRTFIRKQPFQSEKAYLTIPIKKASHHTLINKIEIDHKTNWQSKHLRKLFDIYHKAPHYERYFPLIENILAESQTVENLAQFNQLGIRQIAALFESNTQFVQSSNLAVTGHKFEYNRNLIDYFDAKTYLSGTGAKAYNEDTYFESSGRKLVYNEFYPFLHKHPYFQQQGDFLNGLSILDALFNVGEDGVKQLFCRFQNMINHPNTSS